MKKPIKVNKIIFVTVKITKIKLKLYVYNSIATAEQLLRKIENKQLNWYDDVMRLDQENKINVTKMGRTEKGQDQKKSR